MEKGFVKVPRAILSRKEFSDPALFYAYFVLMSSVRFVETEIDGIRVGVGQLLISKSQLASLFGMSLSRTRSTLERFEKMGGITRENIKNKYTLITVLKPFLTGNINKTSSVLKKDTVFISDKSAVSNESQLKEFSYENRELSEAVFKPSDIEEKSGLAAKTVKPDSIYEDVSPKPDSGAGVHNEGTACDAGCKESSSPSKLAYGKFSNVLLTENEYLDFQKETVNYRYYIDSLSARLMNSGGKKYQSHYALLINNCNEDKLRGRGIFPEEKSKPVPDPTASYDIQRAEERSKKVPTLKKRVPPPTPDYLRLQK